MSHEGIRIVDEATARRERAAETVLPKDATTPAKVRVMQTEGTGVAIDWKDGHRSAWNFAWLRYACPVRDLQRGERKDRAEAGCGESAKASSPLVLYEAPPRPLEVTPVGKYAVKFKWSDGHESGIYSWEYLRRACQCALCKAAQD